MGINLRCLYTILLRNFAKLPPEHLDEGMEILEKMKLLINKLE